MTSRILFGGGILMICAAMAVVGNDRYWVPADTNSLSTNFDRIEKGLRSTTECSFIDKPLEEACNNLEYYHHIEIWIDKQALQDEGITIDQQITLVMTGISLESALHLMLDPLGLAFVSRNEILMITTQAKADEMLSARIYPVRDLVDMGDGSDDYDSLMNAIQQCTSGKWILIDQEGGSMTEFDNGFSLVIRQTQQVHREIEGLLAALRKAKRLQGVASIPIRAANADDSESVPVVEPQRSASSISRPSQPWQRPRVFKSE